MLLTNLKIMRKKIFFMLLAPAFLFSVTSCSGVFQKNCHCPKFGQYAPAKSTQAQVASTCEKVNIQ
jgi:hypothetical protein